MQKNTIGKWIVYAFGASAHATPGDPIAALTDITAGVHIDGAAIDALADISPVELSGGYYIFDIAAVENNGDNVLLIAVSATPNVTVIGVPGALYTTPANFSDTAIAATTGIVDSDVVAIGTSTTAATNLSTTADTMIKGTAVTGTLTTTIFTTSIGATYTVDDAINGSLIIFEGDVTPALKGQRGTITSYTATGAVINISSPLTVAPANLDSWVIV